MSLPQAPEVVKRLRRWREENPKTDFALGFVPGVGTALAVDDFIQEPSVLGAAGLALGPVASRVKALRKAGESMGLIGGRRVWHSSPYKLPKQLEHNPKKMFMGEGLATEGPGFYLTQHPGKSITYIGQNAAINPRKHSWLHQYELPEEEYARFVNSTDLSKTHGDTIAALKRLYPDMSMDELAEHLARQEGLPAPRTRIKSDPRSYEGLGETLEAFRAENVPGVITAAPGRGSYLVTHFPERLRQLGDAKKITPPKGQAPWMAEYDLRFDDWDPADWERKFGASSMKDYKNIRRGRGLWELDERNPNRWVDTRPE